MLRTVCNVSIYQKVSYCHAGGGQVKLWITINEPEWITDGYSGTKRVNLAPGLYLDSPINYIVAYNLLRAHARIYRLYERKYRATQNGSFFTSIETSLYSLNEMGPKINYFDYLVIQVSFP